MTDFYADDLNASRLSAQLAAFASHLVTHLTLLLLMIDCLEYLQSLSDGVQFYYSKVFQVAKLLLAKQATNAFSEHCFPAMRRIKLHLCNTMGQRLNHLMLLHLHKQKLDDLDLVLRGNEHCLSLFGKFDN